MDRREPGSHRHARAVVVDAPTPLRNRRLRGGVLLAALAAAACSGPFWPEERELAEHEARWRAAGLAAYAFDYRLSCFCGPAATRPVTVHVRDGEVTKVVYRDDGAVATPEERELFPTVEDLFERIRTVLGRENPEFEVRYDDELDYPTFFSADPLPMAIDDEFTFRVTALWATEPR